MDSPPQNQMGDNEVYHLFMDRLNEDDDDTLQSKNGKNHSVSCKLT